MNRTALFAAICLTTLTSTAHADPAASNCVVDMKVDGMRCSVSCSPKAVDALKSVAGVQHASVSFDKQTAEVEAKGKTCTAEGHKPLIDALDKVGYTGEVTGTRKKTS